MKYHVKNLVFLAVLASLLIISGCQKQSSEANFPKGDYPPAPRAIMESQLTKIDGTTFKLDDYKGKVILVNLWATWCAPCREEMPDFIVLQEKYRDQGFEIIGLNLDEMEDAPMIKAFGEKMQLNYQLAKGDEKIADEFLKITRRQVIPQSFLIDRDGRLVAVFPGGGYDAVQRIKESVKRFVS